MGTGLAGGAPPRPHPAGGLAPLPDPGPSLPHSRLRTPAGHAYWPSPLRPAAGGAPGLHPHPLPTEYEQQPAPVPSMEKKRTVYQMALSKMAQPCSPGSPGPLAPRPLPLRSALPALFLPAHPFATSDLIISYPSLAPAIKCKLPPLYSASPPTLLPPLHLPSCANLQP